MDYKCVLVITWEFAPTLGKYAGFELCCLLPVILTELTMILPEFRQTNAGMVHRQISLPLLQVLCAIKVLAK